MSLSSPSFPPSPCVWANPDLSGVGIRLSIYGQVFLKVIVAFIFSRHATSSDFQLYILSTSSRNLFLTGGALLICAFYQGSTQGLSVHHTLIVLNLSWIICLSSLLPVFTRAWNVIFRSHCADPVWGAQDLFKHRDSSLGRKAGPMHWRPEPVAEADNLPPPWQYFLPLAAHLGALGFLGVLLSTLGYRPECTPHTVLTVFGSTYSVVNQTFWRGSMGIFWNVAIPILNVIVTGAAAFTVLAVMAFVFSVAKRVANLSLRSSHAIMRYSGIVTISVLLVLFIANNEFTIARGVLVGPGAEQWTFGQMLALVSPVVHGVKMLYIWKGDGGGRGRGDGVVSNGPIQLDLRDGYYGY
ncbi:hypothetical protein EST38_g3672 [Candolleomyces aberdarensis]|uniref:Uncharacterized protein n=1 Tax=Candolleomyces aberdarensis TaxID=2316362 RepID=A0A4Q2DPY6_9AGAR|nr:hypothetical protein EST38_g3672 [Candolleomyces aberdarensis]